MVQLVPADAARHFRLKSNRMLRYDVLLWMAHQTSQNFELQIEHLMD